VDLDELHAQIEVVREMLPSWSSFVHRISSPARSVRPTARESVKLSDVMFAPNAVSAGSQRRNAAAASRACAINASVRRLLPNGPPVFAFDSRK
jgi:hypothetical protein